MNTLEERVLETVEATGLSEQVAELAAKVGVSKQTIYSWKRGMWLKDMKAINLIALADLAGYEPAWIMKGKGLKKKLLTDDQARILEIAGRLEQGARENWIANGMFLASVTPTDKAVDAGKAQPVESPPDVVREKDSTFREFKAPGLIRARGISRGEIKRTPKEEKK